MSVKFRFVWDARRRRVAYAPQWGRPATEEYYGYNGWDDDAEVNYEGPEDMIGIPMPTTKKVHQREEEEEQPGKRQRKNNEAVPATADEETKIYREAYKGTNFDGLLFSELKLS